jgi:hypothetical protein
MSNAKPLKWSRSLPYCRKCGSVQPVHECKLVCCICGRDSFTINLSLHEDLFYCWDHVSHQTKPAELPATEEITSTTHNQLELIP